jgi:hypothetical protein
MSDKPTPAYVAHIPDLMTWDDYEVSHERKLVRFRLTVTEQGLEIIGDSPYPHLLEELLAKLDPTVVEMMLCG